MATFLLVPGSWAGSWCWRRVTPLLRERGHSVYEQTLTGLADRAHLASRRVGLRLHIEDVLSTMRYIATPVVLVGHSYAGFVTTGVADKVPEMVSRLVYVDANLPKTPNSSLFGDFPPAVRRDYAEQARRYGGGWRLPVTKESGNPVFDLSEEDIEMMTSLGTPQPIRTYTEHLSLRGSCKSVRRTFIKCDWPTNPFDTKELRAQGLQTVTIDSGHWPMLSCPQTLAEVLYRCAR